VAENLPKDMSHKVHNALRLTRDDMQRWARILGKPGWLGYGWPKAFGGPGWNAVQKHLFEEECAMAGAPRVVPFGPVMVAPVIMAFGTPEQQQRFLPGIASGEVWWSQGYSEPGAGSDLASLKTRAERRGDKYIVNGQKTWTTLGQYGEWIFCLVRTSTEGKPQTGISFLLIDMKSPGITVRPDHPARRRARGQRGLLRQRRGAGREPDRRGEQGLDLRQAPAQPRAHQHRRRQPRQARARAAQAHRPRRRPVDDIRFRDQIALLEVDIVALEMMVLRVLSAEKSGKQSLDVAGPAEDPRQRDPAALHRADDAGRRPADAALHPRGDGGRLAGRPRRRPRTVPPLAGHLLQLPQDHHLRRQQRSAAQHRRADGPRELNMDFDFTDDQLSLRDAVARWVDKGFAFERRHALAKAGGPPASVYGELAELGLTGLAVPEAHGGMGFGAVEAMVVMEELGRGLVNAPYAAGALVAPALLARHRRAAGRLAAAHGRRRGAGGAGPPGARRALPPEPRGTRARLRRRPLGPRRRQERGAGWRRGRCLHRAGAHVWAPTGDEAGIGLFLVERRRPRCAPTPRRTAPAPPRCAATAPGDADHADGHGGARTAVDIGIAAHAPRPWA
jgi:alkylation response protein AidB-like acyl-CoA dehydrogenase